MARARGGGGGGVGGSAGLRRGRGGVAAGSHFAPRPCLRLGPRPRAGRAFPATGSKRVSEFFNQTTLSDFLKTRAGGSAGSARPAGRVCRAPTPPAARARPVSLSLRRGELSTCRRLNGAGRVVRLFLKLGAGWIGGQDGVREGVLDVHTSFPTVDPCLPPPSARLKCVSATFSSSRTRGRPGHLFCGWCAASVGAKAGGRMQSLV